MNAIYDYVIIGSGFGGSVSAMRLTQKGYKVLLIESGKKWESTDFPKTNWNLRKYLWLPSIFCYGIQRINFLKDVMILSGSGFGGGSLVYGNTLYVPHDSFFNLPTIQKIGGKDFLMPFYNLSKKMLGVVTHNLHTPSDEAMLKTATDLGYGHTFEKNPVGVFFSDDQNTRDPYFDNEGPNRSPCIQCGGCMIGCRYNSKNTLDKNYLYFAQKFGLEVLVEHKVTEIIPHSQDGALGYSIKAIHTTSIFKKTKTFKTKGIIISAGVLGTLSLLLKMKKKHLPNLSPILGDKLRTNSEAILGAVSYDKAINYSSGIAITSSIYPNEYTHIQPVRYPIGSDAMGLLSTLLTDGGGKIPRPLRFIGNVIRTPINFFRTLLPFNMIQRSIIVLVMQNLDNSLKAILKRRWFFPFRKTLTSQYTEGEKSPTYIPLANDFVKQLSKNINGFGLSSIPEVMLNIPTTAHVLGGAIMGENAKEGVIDFKNQVFGYQNMYICDGSMIPQNLGVNPSLSITAFTERAMSFIPPKNTKISYLKSEEKWGTTSLLKNYL